MTLEQFILNAETYHKKYPEYRRGQAYMNYTSDLNYGSNMSIPLPLCGSENDCFYDDSKLGNYLEYIAKHLN